MFFGQLLDFQALEQIVLDRNNVLGKVYNNYRCVNKELHNQILETFLSSPNICFEIHAKYMLFVWKMYKL